MSRSWGTFGTGSELEVMDSFDEDDVLCIQTYDEWSDLTVNQVKDLMVHLQRALDEHGDKTQ